MAGLTIRITKRSADGGDKPPLLLCTRADGSATLSEITVGVAHDLAHYAVETALGFERAFYGLLASGMNIQDFNTAGAAKALDLPPEAGLAEFIVGLLQMELLNGEPYADFNAELRRAVGAGRRSMPEPPALSGQQIGVMRSRLAELLGRWAALPENGTLVLEFPARCPP